ncbi:NmrA family NAD(P)-binding protein [Levilactobacillus bambusae]|uniref:NAD(P)-dependent oxidoreductase n=1 Tax=Levilactobacillus bambusae TaxID=2024736 RepID=A0A2V1N1Q9_9LACO|nr:NmrA family NAD(P)-binding protein [Levilactobacillus bambusae]PWG00286.1 NAD(P)-dependent oxidoreductase [Levilactobacillus bambusae]
MTITVTGATGQLGTKVVHALTKLVGPTNLKLAVHTPKKAESFSKQGMTVVSADYANYQSLVTAFTGTDVLVYIPSITYNVLQRITEFETSLAAMKQAQVKNLVFVSFFADQESNPFQMSSYYAYVPRRLAGTPLNFAILKNSLYADPLVPYLPELIEREGLIYPVQDQALSFITRNDSAEAIAKVAVTPALRSSGQRYLLSQGENFTMPELGALMSTVTGHHIGYHEMTLSEFAAAYADEGDGDELASMYHAGALGLLNGISDDFAMITGHQPETMSHFLTQNWQN